MADITTFYGYKKQFIFYIENNGSNPIDVTNISLSNSSSLTTNNIFTEIENTLPMTVTGNGRIDVINDFYSMNISDYTTDLTYLISYNIVDMSDFTTILDSTTVSVEFDLTNSAITDTTCYSILSKLNKYFGVGPTSSDSTIKSSSFTSTGYPCISFNSAIDYNMFISRYSPQFAVFNNITTGVNIVVGNFYYNIDRKSVECYFTDSEKSDVIGMVFNNLFLFYIQT